MQYNLFELILRFSNLTSLAKKKFLSDLKNGERIQTSSVYEFVMYFIVPSLQL